MNTSEGKAPRGVIRTLDGDIEIKFQYNPQEITDVKSVNYRSRTPRGTYEPTYKFLNGGERSIKFNLTIDSLHPARPVNPDDARYFEKEDPKNIKEVLDNFRKLIYPKETEWTQSGPKPKQLSEGEKYSSPPRCKFSFGNKVIKGFVKTLTITETQYNANLEPVRADIKLTFVEDN